MHACNARLRRNAAAPAVIPLLCAARHLPGGHPAKYKPGCRPRLPHHSFILHYMHKNDTIMQPGSQTTFRISIAKGQPVDNQPTSISRLRFAAIRAGIFRPLHPLEKYRKG